MMLARMLRPWVRPAALQRLIAIRTVHTHASHEAAVETKFVSNDLITYDAIMWHVCAYALNPACVARLSIVFFSWNSLRD
jgi:hypothetical protein